MSSSQEDTILGLPRRPRIGDASASAILGAIALGLITGGWGGVILGGVAGSALANQRQPLEMAIRDYFTKHGLEVIFFYPAPRAAKVTFQYGENDYWTIESVMPDDLQLPPEDTADWLYGNLIKVELPKVQRRIRRAS
ncbi:MAG: hypothetical protein LC785_03180 [Acidobacteria bacterium]|nr:hypothetical protein [Acidobacteriota bacterium]MCA1632850.1 hypothetical protein [Acidobacteriota bacterium]MCA1640986.1 hypothetical protein [Acidobacteriota bacterium]